MNNLLKNKGVLIYCLAGVLGCWFVVKVVFGPFHGKLTNLSAQATIGKERLEKGFNLIENQEAINREYNKYMTYFSLQNVTDKEAVATLLKEVEILSREAGVTIMDMKPQEEAESDKISKQYQINIKAEATMEELIKFLYSLYNAKYLFSIEKLVLAPKNEGASDLNITLSLVGVSFL